MANDRLERSQRAHSQAALASAFSPLSPPPSGSSSSSSTAAAASAGAALLVDDDHSSVTPRRALLSQHGRSKSVTGSTMTTLGRPQSPQTTNGFPSTRYSRRGFETDPFDQATYLDPSHSSCSSAAAADSIRRSWSSSGALAAHEQGDWLERLGKRATTFGRWTTEHESVVGSRASLSHAVVGTRDDESSDEEDEERENALEMGFERPRPPMRTRSSLSVFHDRFETVEDQSLDFDYSSSQPSTPSLSRSRLNSLSAPTSPRASHLRSLEPLDPRFGVERRKRIVVPGSEDLDDPEMLAHHLLAAQDKWGVFSLVESVLEWPWSSSASSLSSSNNAHPKRRPGQLYSESTMMRTSQPPTPRSRSQPVSRVTSHHSLSHLVDDLHLTGATGPPVDVLNESAWTERGELSAYYRAKSSGNLEGLQWEDESRKGKEEMGDRLEKKVAGNFETTSTGGGGEQGKAGIREAIGGLLDTIGLGSFV